MQKLGNPVVAKACHDLGVFKAASQEIIQAADYLGDLAFLLHSHGERDLALYTLSAACRVHNWKGQANSASLASRLGMEFYECSELESSILAHECRLILTPEIVTTRLVLASLYFKRALEHINSDTNTIRIGDADLCLVRAYSYRRDLFELCRIYSASTELNFSSKRPVQLDQALAVTRIIYKYLYRQFLKFFSNIDEKLYELLRLSIRFLGRFQELAHIKRVWLEHCLVRATAAYDEKKFDVYQSLCYSAIDLHADKAANTHELSEYYKLLRLCSLAIGQARNAEMYGRLSLATFSLPSHDTSSIVHIAKKIAINNKIVIAYLSEIYIDMFELWYKFYAKNTNTGLLVFAMDINTSE